MRVIVAVECDVCPERFEVVKDSWGLKLPLNSEIRSEARRQGWHIGRRCICPECLKLAENFGKCAICRHWRNKSMETPSCELDGELALGNDYCDSYDAKEDYCICHNKEAFRALQKEIRASVDKLGLKPSNDQEGELS